MKSIRSGCLRAVVFFLFLLAATAMGQTKSDTPKIIEIVTEAIASQGTGGLESVLIKLKSQSNHGDLRWLGGTFVTGDANRAIAIFEHSNYASLQQSHQALHTAWESLPGGQRPVLQVSVYDFTPEQTYNDGHVPWWEARAFGLYSVHLNTGGYDDYVEQQHIAVEYLLKAKIKNEEWLGYTQHYGPQSPGYIYVTPLRSTSDLDITEDRPQIFPAWVDRGRDAVLLKAVASSSIDLVLVRPELSKGLK